jgi:hypothetical protein
MEVRVRGVRAHVVFTERPGSRTPGQWGSIANPGAIPALRAAG